MLTKLLRKVNKLLKEIKPESLNIIQSENHSGTFYSLDICITFGCAKNYENLGFEVVY